MNMIPLSALDRPIAYHRIFRKVSGSTVAAVFLSQAWYWSQRIPEDRDGWFYKKQAEWEDETGLSRSEQETARKKLVQIGILEEKREGLPAVLWYRIDIDQLSRLIRDELGNAGTPQSSFSDTCNPDAVIQATIHTENTTETTSLMRPGEREKDAPKEPPKFMEFYQAYPRKKARADALKAWKSIKPDDELAGRIVNAAKTQAETTYKGKEQQYIPYPATWLRAGQWDDEIEDPRQSGDGTLISMYGDGFNPLKSLPKEELNDYNKELEAAKAREMERERGVG